MYIVNPRVIIFLCTPLDLPAKVTSQAGAGRKEKTLSF